MLCCKNTTVNHLYSPPPPRKDFLFYMSPDRYFNQKKSQHTGSESDLLLGLGARAISLARSLLAGSESLGRPCVQRTAL